MKSVLLVVALFVISIAPSYAGDLSWTAEAGPTVNRTVQTTGWDWNIEPELGAGLSIINGQQFSAALSLRVGRTPADFPVIPGREFGVALGKVGGRTAGGPWLGITDLPGGLKLRLGALIWGDAGLKADACVWIAKPFTVGE